MTNAELVTELAEMERSAAELRELLGKSDVLPALPLASGLVELSKLRQRLLKASVVLAAVAAPLFGRDDDQAGPAPAPRPRKK